MNRNQYASEYEKRNNLTNISSFEADLPRPRSLLAARRMNRSKTLDNIDQVNLYVEDLCRSADLDDNERHLRTTKRIIERPITPPPPVISFHSSDRNNRREVVNDDVICVDPLPLRRARRKSMDWRPTPPSVSSFMNYDLKERNSRQLRNREIDRRIDCTLSPVEIALNRGEGSLLYSRTRNSPVRKDYQDTQKQRKDRDTGRPIKSVHWSSDLESQRAPEPAPPAKKRKDLILTIIDEGPNYNHLSQSNWRLVERALCMIYLDIMHKYPGPPPVCRDAGWFLGCAKLIECADERSQRLYEYAISRLGEVWPGARLKIVNRNEITKSAIRVRCTTFVPAHTSDKQKILECIQLCNPDIPTSDWRVWKVGTPSRVTNERHITLSFGIESLPYIEERRGVIRYAFDKITLKVNKRDMDWMQRIYENGHSVLENLDGPFRNRNQRRWSEMEVDEDEYDEYDDDDAIIITDTEDDEGSDY